MIQLAQANSNNSTTESAISTRRRFLSQAAGVAAGGTVLALATIPPVARAAAPREALDGSKASPELRSAARALDEANDRLTAAKARFDEADRKMAAWTEANPEPEGKRPLKRWSRRWREVHDATLGDSWDAQLEAERDFRTCQMAVAKVTPRDEKDLMLKAALAAVYDKVKHASYGDVAIISYSVVMDLFALRMPA
jgi:hypothetical protein